MNAISQLRDERRSVAREMRNLLDQHPGRSWGATQQRKYDTALERIEALDSQITQAERQRDAATGRALGLEEIDADAAGAFRAWTRSGLQALSPVQRRIYDTMSTGTGSQGGYTVPSDISTRFVDALKDFSGVRRVAEVIVTATGANIPWPTSDGTSETAELVAENATATGADPVFGTAPLPTYKYSSKIFTVPFELLQDSNIDVEQFIFDRAAARIGRLTNSHFTVGTGSGQPQGFAGAATAGKVGTTGQTLTVIHDDIVDLVHSVNVAYRQDPRGAWPREREGAHPFWRRRAGRLIRTPAQDGPSRRERAGARVRTALAESLSRFP
jgi:HK97 family phage major capsid protein